MKSKLPDVTTSIFTVMSKMAVACNAINLSQGFPDFPGDPVLIEGVTKAMKAGYNQYAPMPGVLRLREAISQKAEVLYRTHYHPEHEITITNGATQALFTAIGATIHKGDEVIIFTPAYDCYAPAVILFGGTVIPVQLYPPFYAPDWEMVSEKITKRTRMIIINSPHNPSGTVFSEADMLQLEGLAEQHDLLVLSDEVYEHIIFDENTHESAAKFPGLASRAFITASFGKTFHNTGWKIGYCLAPAALMKEFKKVHEYNVFCVNHPLQIALTDYLQTPDNYLQLNTFYQQKRDLLISLLKASRFKLRPSRGTYFQLLDFSEISSESDVAFAKRLTKEYKVATIPTSVFNACREDFKQIRVCFAKKEETLQQAAAILSGL